MKPKPAIDYLNQKPDRKNVNARVLTSVADAATLAAETLGVPVCELWEAAMRKFLEELKPELKKAGKHES